MRDGRGELRYLLAACAARVADEGTAVAVVLLSLQRTGGAAEGALVLAAWTAPHAVAAPLVGTVAVRVRRVRLAFAVLLAALAAATAALAGAVGRADLPLLLAVALVGGSCGPVVSGGLSSLPARLSSPGAARGRAYARDAGVHNLAALVGPALATAVAVTFSPAWSLLLLAAAALVAALLTLSLPLADEDRAPGERVGVLHDLAAGMRAVWTVAELRAVTAATCLAFVGIGALTTLTVLLAESRGTPGGGGLLLTVLAAGGVVGAFALDRLRPGADPRSVVVAGFLVTGAGLAVAALVPSSVVPVGCYLAAGVGDGLLLAATLRLRADHAPSGRRAQVFTIGAGLKVAAAAVGAGAAATAASSHASLYLLAAALLQPAAALCYVLLRRR